MPGRDLVFVQYAEDYTIHYEWVYNEADIDASSVVWAQDLGPEANRLLSEYYVDRKAWLLSLSAGVQPRLTEYHPSFAR